MSGGQSRRNLVYVARRYFQMSIQEMEALPWWEPIAMIDGLFNDGTLQKPDEARGDAIDLTNDPIDSISGFTTRRAG